MQSKWLKPALALFLCIFLILGAAGCSSSAPTAANSASSAAPASSDLISSASDTPTATDSVSTDTPTATDAISSASGAPAATDSGSSGGSPVTLRFMAYNTQSSRATYLQYLADNYPGATIQYDFITVDDFDSVLTSQLQAGSGPDIIEVGGQAKMLANAGYLLDLTDQSFTSKYGQAGLAAYTVNGKNYATPLQSWYEGVFYNKDIFAANNISVPKTWDQFIQIHKDLQAKGIQAEIMGAQDWQPLMKQSIAMVNNMFYSDSANSGFDAQFNAGTAKVADAWLPAVTEWYKTVQAGDLTSDMLGVSPDQALADFAAGKGAMWEYGPWGVNDLLAANPNLNLGMFPFPGPDANTPGWLVGGPGSGLAINAKSPYTQQALQILDLTATPDAQTALIKDNAGGSYLLGYTSELGPIYDDCQAAFAAGHVYACWTSDWDYGNACVEAYGKALQDVLSGNSTIQQALQVLDQANDDARSAVAGS